MSEFLRNTAGQLIDVSVVDSSNGAAKTSGVNFWVTKDSGSQAAAAGSSAYKGHGQWQYAFTQAETNAGTIGLAWDGTNVIPGGVTIYTKSNPVGSGSQSKTLLVEDTSGHPIGDAEVWITTDIAGTNVVAGTLRTDDFGLATFLLDPGTYYVWRDHAGHEFTNPQAIVVS